MALVEMLIKSGATVDQAKANGATPLYIAFQNGKLEVVKALIEAKAKVNRARRTALPRSLSPPRRASWRSSRRSSRQRRRSIWAQKTTARRSSPPRSKVALSSSGSCSTPVPVPPS